MTLETFAPRTEEQARFSRVKLPGKSVVGERESTALTPIRKRDFALRLSDLIPASRISNTVMDALDTVSEMLFTNKNISPPTLVPQLHSTFQIDYRDSDTDYRDLTASDAMRRKKVTSNEAIPSDPTRIELFVPWRFISGDFRNEGLLSSFLTYFHDRDSSGSPLIREFFYDNPDKDRLNRILWNSHVLHIDEKNIFAKARVITQETEDTHSMITVGWDNPQHPTQITLSVSEMPKNTGQIPKPTVEIILKGMDYEISEHTINGQKLTIEELRRLYASINIDALNPLAASLNRDEGYMRLAIALGKYALSKGFFPFGSVLAHHNELMIMSYDANRDHIQHLLHNHAESIGLAEITRDLKWEASDAQFLAELEAKTPGKVDRADYVAGWTQYSIASLCHHCALEAVHRGVDRVVSGAYTDGWNGEGIFASRTIARGLGRPLTLTTSHCLEDKCLEVFMEDPRFCEDPVLLPQLRTKL